MALTMVCLSPQAPMPFLVYDGWVYYSEGSGPMTRIQTDGKNKMTLTQTQTRAFNILNGRLVLTNYDGSGITIMNLDGSSPQVISDAEATYLYEVNDWLYYINNDQWGPDLSGQGRWDAQSERIYRGFGDTRSSRNSGSPGKRHFQRQSSGRIHVCSFGRLDLL